LPADTRRFTVADDDIQAGGDTPPDAPYEPPRIDLLGTVKELTHGPSGVGGDLDGHVISF
jgi:hypothetical protein